jgi:hypothetical protein
MWIHSAPGRGGRFQLPVTVPIDTVGSKYVASSKIGSRFDDLQRLVQKALGGDPGQGRAELLPSVFADKSAPGSAQAAQTERAGSEQPYQGAVIDGRYELEHEVSRGGMGNVFRARHHTLGRAFAIKFVHADLRDEAAMRRQFLNEAQLAASLNHPHIVSVTDFGLDPVFGNYLVMELLNGETLSTRLCSAGQCVSAAPH